MAFGIIVYDDARRIVAIDEAAAEIFGMPPEGLTGRTITDFVPGPDRGQMAETRATFERLGVASGQYALEREDGSRESVAYSVLANAPLPGLNLMALGRFDAALVDDAVRIRRVGQDVLAGLETSDEEHWLGTSSPTLRSAPPATPVDPSGSLVAAVFPTEQDAWAALQALQPKIAAPIEIGLSSFDGGRPRDTRSVLAVRTPDRNADEVAAIVAEFGGSLMAGQSSR